MHEVARLTVAVAVGDLPAGLALRARIEDLAHGHFPRVIERTLAALAPEDLAIAIDRIDLDLGAIAVDAFEQEVPATFERALAEALSQAFAAARAAPPPGMRVQPLDAAATENFETYLRRGVPDWDAAAFDPAERFDALLERPQPLLAMLRRHARERYMIERLVVQLGEARLRALLGLLAPADAALILRYHIDLLKLGRSQPQPLADPALRRITWVLTLEYLLREPGSEFNRRAFVAHLLRGLAEEQGVPYARLLALMRDALRATRRKRPIAGSLPAVIGMLIAEEGPDEPAAVHSPAAASDIDRLAQRIRAAAKDPAALARLVRQLDAERFAALLDRLEPADAQLILRHLDTLARVHAAALLVALSQDALVFQLRLLTLRHLLANAGTRFNRRAWLQRLLRGLAGVTHLPYAVLLEAIEAALVTLRRTMPVQGDFVTAVADLAADLPMVPGGATTAGADAVALLAARLRRYRDDEAISAMLAAGIANDAFARLVEHLAPPHATSMLADLERLRERHREEPLAPLAAAALDRRLRLLALAWLLRDPQDAGNGRSWQSYLRRALAAELGVSNVVAARLLGKAPAMEEDVANPVALALEMARADAAGLVRLRGRLATGRWHAAVAALGDAAWQHVLATAAPFAAARVIEDLALLERAHAAVPLAALDAAAFRTLIRALALDVLAGRARFDRADLRAALLRGIARHEGVVAGEFGDWRRLVRERLPDPSAGPGAALALVELYLRTGEPRIGGGRIAGLAAADSPGFAALLRRLVAANSGRTGALVARLLEWMLPDEIFAVLRPDLAGQGDALAHALASAPGVSLADAWGQLLDRALRGGGLAPMPREAPEPTPTLALLRYRLDQGALPPGMPPGSDLPPLSVLLSGLDLPALRAFFADDDGDRLERRLRRAVAELGPEAGRALLLRLVPPAAGAATLSDAERLRMVVTAMRGGIVRQAAEAAPRREAPDLEREIAEADGHLLAWLRGDGPDRYAEQWALRIAALARRGDPALDIALRAGLARSEARTRWARLPAETLAQIAHRLAPSRARALIEIRALLAAAWRVAMPSHAAEGEAALGAALVALLASGATPSLRAIVDALLVPLMARAPAAAGRLRAEAARRADQAGLSHMRLAFRPVAGITTEPARAQDRLPEAEEGEVHYVVNAGLVLVGPFLPHLFDQLGVLVPDADGTPRIAGPEALSRAVHLLQYLVDGRCDAPEPELALNKLIAGAPVSAPIAAAIEPSAADLALCDSLLGAVIANWTIISTTSVAGLRETFLQREGKLVHGSHGWTLTVQRKTVDVLVDQIPWSIGLLYHRWMQEALHVQW